MKSRVSVAPLLAALVACGSHGEPAHHEPAPAQRSVAEATRAGPAPAAVDAMREAVLAHAALQPGMVVADVGAGGGWFVFRVAKAVGVGATVYATDIDPRAVSYLRERAAHPDTDAAHIDVRLCRDGRDTALDDVPADHVDVILMVDSLCFDGRQPHADDVGYLRRLRRILRPGGRFLHHMDCGCATTPQALIALFAEAGLAHAEDIRVPSGASPACATVPVFRK